MAASPKADVFEDEAISDIWMDVTDITGDAAVAKDVMMLLASRFYALPWDKWSALQEATK